MRQWRAVWMSGLLLAGTAGLALSACETALDPSYVLDAPRILAIRTTPVYLVPDSGVSLDALVYAPPGSPPPVYTWSWCASVNATLQCATTAAALVALLDPTDSGAVAINYDLGANATALFNYPASPDVIKAACARRLVDGGVVDASDDDAGDDAADAGDDAGDAGDDAGEGGVGPSGLACNGTTWTVDVLLTVTVGDKTMQATRQVTLYLDPPTELNENPTIVGIAPFTNAQIPSEAGPLEDPSATLDGGDAAIEIDAGIGPLASGGYELAADVPFSSSELYSGRNASGFGPLGPDDAGTDVSGDAAIEAGTYESLDLSWFVERGTLDHATTSLPAAQLGAPRNFQSFLTNHWVPPPNAGTTALIVVARDGRGGVGWTVVTAVSP